ncbi:MAG: cupin domain-containing protein [Halobacteria archaeon]|nr:cupin domain-containing protein [Halobacteria archaeon]
MTDDVEVTSLNAGDSGGGGDGDGDGSGGRGLLFGSPKTVCLELTEGEEIPPHRHPGERIVALVTEGVLEMRLDDTAYTLEVGDIVVFDGDCDISPKAVEDCQAVLVFVPEQNENES